MVVALITATLIATNATAVFGDDDTVAAQIARQYHRADVAFAQKNVDGVFAKELPTWTSENPAGKSMTLAAARAATRYLWRDQPNERRVIWRGLTDVTSFRAEGDRATAQVVSHIQRTSVDINGTLVDVHQVTHFVDQWKKLHGEWRLAGTHLIDSRRYGGGRPSAYMLERIDNMRRQGEMLRDFNAGINHSNCMYSDQMQKFDYYEREQRCGS